MFGVRGTPGKSATPSLFIGMRGKGAPASHPPVQPVVAKAQAVAQTSFQPQPSAPKPIAPKQVATTLPPQSAVSKTAHVAPKPPMKALPPPPPQKQAISHVQKPVVPVRIPEFDQRIRVLKESYSIFARDVGLQDKGLVKPEKVKVDLILTRAKIHEFARWISELDPRERPLTVSQFSEILREIISLIKGCSSLKYSTGDKAHDIFSRSYGLLASQVCAYLIVSQKKDGIEDKGLIELIKQVRMAVYHNVENLKDPTFSLFATYEGEKSDFFVPELWSSKLVWGPKEFDKFHEMVAVFKRSNAVVPLHHMMFYRLLAYYFAHRHADTHKEKEHIESIVTLLQKREEALIKIGAELSQGAKDLFGWVACEDLFNALQVSQNIDNKIFIINEMNMISDLTSENTIAREMFLTRVQKEGNNVNINLV